MQELLTVRPAVPAATSVGLVLAAGTPAATSGVQRRFARRAPA